MRLLLLFAVLNFGTGAGFARAQNEPTAQKAPEKVPASFASADEPVPAPASDDDFADFEDEFGEEAMQEAGTKKVFDPLSGYNRFMFKVNDKFYFWLAKPLAKGYRFVVPEPARASVGKAFHNLHFPLRFASSLLQLKFKKSGVELGRFLVNSTVGIGGLFDPADRWLHWRRPGEEDLGQILGHYGVGDGIPIVLPLMGQTNLRDGLARVPEFFLNPVWYVADTPTNIGVAAGEQFNFISLHIGEYESIKKDALDPYTFVRDAYKQNRDKKIRE